MRDWSGILLTIQINGKKTEKLRGTKEWKVHVTQPHKTRQIFFVAQPNKFPTVPQKI